MRRFRRSTWSAARPNLEARGSPLQDDGVSIGIEQFDPLQVREYTLLELKRVIVRRGDDPSGPPGIGSLSIPGRPLIRVPAAGPRVRAARLKGGRRGAQGALSSPPLWGTCRAMFRAKRFVLTVSPGRLVPEIADRRVTEGGPETM